MPFNLKTISKYSQQAPVDAYRGRFDNNPGAMANEPGAVIKNGIGAPKAQVGDGYGTPMTTGNPAAVEPVKVDHILRALNEIATTGKLSDQTQSTAEFNKEQNRYVQDQSNSYADLVAIVGQDNAIGIANLLDTYKDNTQEAYTLILKDSKESPQQAAKRYIKLLSEYKNDAEQESKETQGMNTMASNSFNLYKISAEQKKEKPKPKTSYEKEQTDDQKKKHGGNPFRVLMGIVGKLLDKGWSQNDIVRHVRRSIKFDPKTIKDCIKIVKQYNKKKHRETTALSFNLRQVIASEAIERAANGSELLGTYSIEADLKKKSTRELIIRLKYLVDASNYNSSKDNDTRTNGPQGDLTSCASEISKIESALRERGWEQEAINHEKELIQKNRYYPFDTNVEN